MADDLEDLGDGSKLSDLGDGSNLFDLGGGANLLDLDIEGSPGGEDNSPLVAVYA